MPITRSILEDKGFNIFGRRDDYDVTNNLPLAESNQWIPNTSIDLSKTTIDTFQVNQWIRGGATGYNSGTGWWIGNDGSAYKLFIGNSAGDKVTWDGTTLSVSGTLTAGSIHIPDVDTTANSMHVETDGDTWWGCTQTNWTADHNNATAYILSTGVAKFQEVTVTGNSNIELGTGASVLKANYTDGIWLGATTFASALFSVSLAGSVKATSGTIGGWTLSDTVLKDAVLDANANVLIDSDNSLIRLGSEAGNYLTLDGANQRIRSSNYMSGNFGKGFSLSPELLEVGNISARGQIRTANFVKDNISSIAGSQAISPDSTVLDADISSTDTTITLKTDTIVDVGDILRLKEGTSDEWMIVANTDSAPTYTVLREVGGFLQIATMDSLTADGGTWTVSAAGTNLTVETTGQRQGDGWLKFDLNGVTYTYGNLQGDITSLDLSDYIGVSYVYTWLYISDLTNFSFARIYFTIGSASGIYTTGYKVDGGSWEVGWNLVYFPFYDVSYGRWIADMDITAITRIYLQIIQSSKTAVSGYGYDGLWIKKIKTPETNRTHYYPFYENTGTNLMDYGYDNIRTGTITGATWSTDKPSISSYKSLIFTGNAVTDYVDIDYRAVDGLDDFTFNIWVKLTAGVSTDPTIMSGSRAGDFNEFFIYYSEENNRFRFTIRGGNVYFSNSTIEDGAWHMVTVTRSGTDCKMYIDGSQIDTTQTVSTDALDVDSGGFILGQEQDSVGGGFSATQAWSGKLALMKIFDAALGQTAITALYTTGISEGLEAIPYDSWTKGSTVVNYGQDGEGLIYLTASDTDSPYIDIATQSGTPWDSDSNDTKVRVGNLEGITDSDFGGALSGYGIYTTNGYFKGTVDVGSQGKIKGGQTDYATGTGFFLGKSSGIDKFSVGSTTQYLRFDGTNMFFSGALTLLAPVVLPSYTVATLPVPPSSEGPQSPSSNAY